MIPNLGASATSLGYRQLRDIPTLRPDFCDEQQYKLSSQIRPLNDADENMG